MSDDQSQSLQLLVEPTHLKPINVVKLDHFLRDRGEHKNCEKIQHLDKVFSMVVSGSPNRW